MDATNQRSTTPRDVARVLFRQRRKMVLFFGAVIGLTLLVIALYPRAYSSESKLFLRIGRESVALDPTVTTGPTNLLQKTQADEVNSSLNILSSRALLERVVEHVGAARILDVPPTGDPSAANAESSDGIVRRAVDFARGCVDGLLITLHLSDPCSERDLAIRRLEKGVMASAPKESTVITISYAARSPELAHDVVDAITNVFLEEHLRLYHSAGALDFFSAQAEQLHRELLAAQTELRDRKNAFQLTSNTNRPSILEKSKEALRQKLYDLEQQESDLKSRYTDEYPPLQEIRRQLAEAENLLTVSPADPPAATGTGLRVPAVPQVANEPRRDLDADLQTVNDQGYQLAQLELGVQLLEGKYRLHVEKLEQARINDALERQHISNVEVAQAATLVRRPEAPQKRLLFLLGLIVATAGALGLAFLAESLDQSLRTVEQVEAKLGLPVLLTLPLRNGQRLRIPTLPTTAGNGKIAPAATEHDLHPDLARYRPLLRRLLANGANREQRGRGTRKIGVIGCDSSTLGSQVATDLAIQAASSTGRSVLLIDTDSRGQRVNKRYQINGVLSRRDGSVGATAADGRGQHPNPNNLTVLSGEATNGLTITDGPPVGLLEQLDEVPTDDGLVVIDLPSTGALDELLPAAESCDETVLVIEAERTHIQAAQRARSCWLGQEFRSPASHLSIDASTFRVGCISGCNRAPASAIDRSHAGKFDGYSGQCQRRLNCDSTTR